MKHGRAFRRHQAERHMQRRLKEDRNQHYRNLDCPCWYDPKTIARFREQPKICGCWMCRNPRRVFKGLERFTFQERKFYVSS